MRILSGTAALLLLLAACDNGGSQPSAGAANGGAAGEASAAPTATGTVIEVKAITDEQGNRFDPVNVTAKPGDVIRLTLVSGVHNLSFPADKNAGAGGLPGPSEMLQLPGQTADIPVTMAPGTYQFQCDPHAALGMTGTLTVEQ